MSEAKDRSKSMTSVVTSSTTGKIGLTVQWSSPELLKGKKKDSASDVFALAVTLWEIFERDTPFSGMVDAIVINQILTGVRPAFENTPVEFRTLIERAWSNDTKMRPKAAQMGFGVFCNSTLSMNKLKLRKCKTSRSTDISVPNMYIELLDSGNTEVASRAFSSPRSTYVWMLPNSSGSISEHTFGSELQRLKYILHCHGQIDIQDSKIVSKIELKRISFLVGKAHLQAFLPGPNGKGAGFGSTIFWLTGSFSEAFKNGRTSVFSGSFNYAENKYCGSRGMFGRLECYFKPMSSCSGARRSVINIASKRNVLPKAYRDGPPKDKRFDILPRIKGKHVLFVICMENMSKRSFLQQIPKKLFNK
ncbi:unnamed protein product [Bathycoccus prasinos]